MRRPGSKQRRIVVLLLAVLTFGIAYYGGNKYTEVEPPQISGVLLRPVMPAPDFELTDHLGKAFTKTQLEDHWSLVLLDPHPTSEPQTLLRLVQIHNRLAIEPLLQRQVRFVYIPRQTVKSSEVATPNLGFGFFSLNGTTGELAETFSNFGVDQLNEGSTLLLVDPHRNIQALFTDGLDAATIAHDLISLITHHRP